jgi:hypothetical protein
MDTKNVNKTEKITSKCHYKREAHVNNTTKNRKNEKILRIFSLFMRRRAEEEGGNWWYCDVK